MTARRREEKLQDVPVSIAVLGGGELATKGVQQTGDLQYVTPSIKTFPAVGRPNAANYEIRGISTTESLITQDPATGIYVNEVYRARPVGTNQSFYDIENVQVLYGPQGTLFGRNSTAGAVLINTRRPTFNAGGELSVTYGNFNRREIMGVLNLPLNDTLALRVAGQYVKRDGYARDIVNDRRVGNWNRWSGRASLLWEPTDGISNLLIGNYFEADEQQAVVGLYNIRPCAGGRPPASCLYTAPGDQLVNLNSALAAQRQRGPYQVAYDPGGDFYDRPTVYGFSNATTIALNDSISVKNILGYNRTKYLANTDLDGSPIKLIETGLISTATQWSNEVQILGEHDRFNWVVGGLFFDERGRDIQNSIQLAGFNPNNTAQTNTRGVNKSYAIFVSGTYKITPELSATAGARYSWDKREVEYQAFNRAGQPTAVCMYNTTTYPGCFAAFKKSYEKPTYTFSVDYKVTPDILLYGVTRQGYRSGGFNARGTSAAQFTPFNPETIRDVEGGFKGMFRFGSETRLQTNLAVYQAWYYDIQRVVAFDPDGPGPQSQTTNIVNAASATIKGFEASAALTLVRGFDISGFWGHVKGRYKAFTTGGVTLRNVAFAGSPNSYGATVSLTPLDDDRLGKATFSATYSLRDAYFGDLSAPFLEPESRVPAQHLVNLSLTWDRIMDSSIRAQAWVRNATNEQSISGALALAGTLGISSAIYGEPRTYGLTLGYTF